MTTTHPDDLARARELRKCACDRYLVTGFCDDCTKLARWLRAERERALVGSPSSGTVGLRDVATKAAHMCLPLETEPLKAFRERLTQDKLSHGALHYMASALLGLLDDAGGTDHG